MKKDLQTNIEAFLGYLNKEKFIDSDDMEQFNLPMEDIEELRELIFDNTNWESENIEEKIIKLSFHFSLNSDMTLKELINSFDYIMSSYDLYKDFNKSEDWAEVYNKEYKFVDTTDVMSIYHNFNLEEKEIYIKNIGATFDLGEELQDKIYTVDFYEVLEELDSLGILQNENVSIEPYLDWENKVREMRASAFYIDEFNDMVIVHQF